MLLYGSTHRGQLAHKGASLAAATYNNEPAAHETPSQSTSSRALRSVLEHPLQTTGACTVLEGLPNFVDYVIASGQCDSPKSARPLITHYLLGDMLNAAQHALTHYFPISLNEHYLQNSSLGTPYQKWAHVTTKDFERLDRTIKRLIPVAWSLHKDYLRQLGGRFDFVIKRAWALFASVAREYESCVIKQDSPLMILSHINVARLDQERSEQHAVNRDDWRPRKRSETLAAITLSYIDISDRSVLHDQQAQGLERLQQMRSSVDLFSEWLRRHYRIEDVTTPHAGTLNEGCF